MAGRTRTHSATRRQGESHEDVPCKHRCMEVGGAEGGATAGGSSQRHRRPRGSRGILQDMRRPWRSTHTGGPPVEAASDPRRPQTHLTNGRILLANPARENVATLPVGQSTGQSKIVFSLHAVR
jgi:hypothetical protein